MMIRRGFTWCLWSACAAGVAVTAHSLAAGKPGCPHHASAMHVHRVAVAHLAVPRADVERGMADLELLVRQASVTPVFQDGGAIGYQLGDMPAQGLLAQLGLHNQDIVMRVNGYTLTDPRDGFHAYASVSANRVVTADLIRNDQMVTIVYRIE
jgi:type II secretory pathway component PulC